MAQYEILIYSFDDVTGNFGSTNLFDPSAYGSITTSADIKPIRIVVEDNDATLHGNDGSDSTPATIVSSTDPSIPIGATIAIQRSPDPYSTALVNPDDPSGTTGLNTIVIGGQSNWFISHGMRITPNTTYTETSLGSAPYPSYLELICFTEGMMIESENGEIAVEDIQIGDKLRTFDNGFQPVRYVYKRTVLGTNSNAPVVFEKGAIGNDRELVVSQKHNMYTGTLPIEVLPAKYHDLRDHLVHAQELVNGSTIRIRAELKPVTYYHIMLNQHELLYCHGTISESWHPLKRNLRRFKGKDDATRKELLELFPEIKFNNPQTCPHVRESAQWHHYLELIGNT